MTDVASLFDPMKRGAPAERRRSAARDAVQSLLMDQATAQLNEHRLAQLNWLLVDIVSAGVFATLHCHISVKVSL